MWQQQHLRSINGSGASVNNVAAAVSASTRRKGASAKNVAAAAYASTASVEPAERSKTRQQKAKSERKGTMEGKGGGGG